MDVYILDEFFRRTAVIDRFESLIWTERWQAYGDFELNLHSTVQSRGLLTKGKRLAILGSTRVMTIETVENKEDSEGRSILSCTGRSIEAIMTERVARQSNSSMDANPKWVITNSPLDVAMHIWTQICDIGVLGAQDKIPFLQPGTIYLPGTLPEYEDAVTVEITPRSVYDAIREICEQYDLGFRLVRWGDQMELFFDIYTGNDRTTQQTTLAPVVFSPSLDNLTNVTELSSIETYKNVANVVAKNGYRIVYGPDADETLTGFDRRVLFVDASDIELAAGTALQDALEQRGQEQLALNRSMEAIDGEVPQNSMFEYERDYLVGDLVEMRNSDGVTTKMRVTEQIIVSDSEGDRSYPTLNNNQFITPGSWYSFEYNIEWDDVSTTLVWADA